LSKPFLLVAQNHSHLETHKANAPQTSTMKLNAFLFVSTLSAAFVSASPTPVRDRPNDSSTALPTVETNAVTGEIEFPRHKQWPILKYHFAGHERSVASDFPTNLPQEVRDLFTARLRADEKVVGDMIEARPEVLNDPEWCKKYGRSYDEGRVYERYMKAKYSPWPEPKLEAGGFLGRRRSVSAPGGTKATDAFLPDGLVTRSISSSSDRPEFGKAIMDAINTNGDLLKDPKWCKENGVIIRSENHVSVDITKEVNAWQKAHPNERLDK
jgi:hypothetical protein